MPKVLIIDDDRHLCEMLCRKIDKMGHETAMACTLSEGLARVNAMRPDVVFLDVMLPDGNGLEALPLVKSAPSNPEVIIFTGLSSADGAELAITNGAWDYIAKPASLQGMILPLIRALEYRFEKQRQTRPVVLKRGRIIGDSPQLVRCLDVIAQASQSDAPVLIGGETGVGKELAATAIHENSNRADERFVVVDCAALPGTLVESILFGHTRGAFTGADRAQAGLAAQAHGGSLFLDEVGDMPLAIQRVFLRVLQEKRFTPLGAKDEVFSDFRVIAATNRDLSEESAAGRFREDLLFRLRSLTVTLPPLRERRDDIGKLALYFLNEISNRAGQGTKGLSPGFLEACLSYPWPGNVRELINTMEQAAASAGSSPILHSQHLPVNIRVHLARTTARQTDSPKQIIPRETLPPLKEVRRATEFNYLKDLISMTDGRIDDACRISGLSRSRLYGLLKTHDLQTK